jgi:hypothetical protein
MRRDELESSVRETEAPEDGRLAALLDEAVNRAEVEEVRLLWTEA